VQAEAADFVQGGRELGLLHCKAAECKSCLDKPGFLDFALVLPLRPSTWPGCKTLLTSYASLLIICLSPSSSLNVAPAVGQKSMYDSSSLTQVATTPRCAGLWKANKQMITSSCSSYVQQHDMRGKHNPMHRAAYSRRG
jgi:hypothetical protein